MHRSQLLILVAFSSLTAGCAAELDVSNVEQQITGGAQDFTHVAVAAVNIDIGTGWGNVCSGTLIAPNIVLTAAHCFYPDDVVAVSFAQDIAPGWPIPDSIVQYEGSFFLHPDFVPNGANPTNTDMAVIVLDTPVPNIAPMPLAAAGVVDGLAHKSPATLVGYGMDEALGLGNGSASWTDERRSANIHINHVTKGFLQASSKFGGDGSACFGDSGGATLAVIDGIEVVVGVTTIADGSCVSLLQASRTDTTTARDFLGEFVTLP